MQETQKKYPSLLQKKELENWTHKVIEHFVKPENIPVGEEEKPKYILLTGQAGAGKTFARKRIKKDLEGNPPVAFGSDDIRELHPKAAEILRTDQPNYPRRTKPDASYARDKLLNYCFSSRRNIMIDSILLNPDDYNMPTFTNARRHGYQVVCMALAVPEELSMVSLFLRQEEQYKQGKIGFPPTVLEHDKSYHLLPELLGKMIKERTVDRLDILTRDGTILYSTDPKIYPDLKGTDRWNPTVVTEIMKQGRRRQLTEQQLAEIDKSWKKIIKMMRDRSAPTDEIKMVQQYYKNFLTRPRIVSKQNVSGKEGILHKRERVL